MEYLCKKTVLEGEYNKGEVVFIDEELRIMLEEELIEEGLKFEEVFEEI